MLKVPKVLFTTTAVLSRKDVTNLHAVTVDYSYRIQSVVSNISGVLGARSAWQKQRLGENWPTVLHLKLFKVFESGLGAQQVGECLNRVLIHLIMNTLILNARS